MNRTKMTAVALSALLCLMEGMSVGGCARRAMGPEVALVMMEVEGQKYRLRSVYWPGTKKSFNELIGPGFVARDQDQDGVIDAVVLGDFRLEEAQRIYEEIIASLATQNRLRRVEPDSRSFACEEKGLRYQVKTLEVEPGRYQNEFRVSRTVSPPAPEIAIAIDAEADGVLDRLVKGEVDLAELQPMYSACIKRGMERARIVRSEQAFVVKER